MSSDNRQSYLVVKKKQETSVITTLFLTLSDGTTPPYIPGQFITVYFDGSSTPNGKAYSISSAPFEKVFRLTIKAVGEFSNKLCSLKRGDVLSASLPWGFFSSKRSEGNLFIIAAGIGITPFRSIILDITHRTPLRHIHFFYSVRTSEEVLFHEDFDRIVKRYRRLHIKKYLTRKTPSLLEAIYGRIKTEDILDVASINTPAEFLICGPASFVYDQRNGLCTAGILEEDIYTEITF